MLAPPSFDASLFSAVAVSGLEYRRLLAAAQRLRGSIYLRDGAVQPSQLTADGRHVQREDQNSWHLLTVDENGVPAACARCIQHENTTSFSDLTISRSALAKCKRWGRVLRTAVEDELRSAHSRDVEFFEIGGWAISEALRCSTEAVRMLISFYALMQLLGGVVGVSTATTRHSSSSIIRRIGGRSLVGMGVELPSYYDPEYKCEMEVIRFDSLSPNPRYISVIEECRDYLRNVTVIRPTPEFNHVENHSGIYLGVPSLRPAAAFGAAF
jgi:hypothetical protein